MTVFVVFVAACVVASVESQIVSELVVGASLESSWEETIAQLKSEGADTVKNLLSAPETCTTISYTDDEGIQVPGFSLLEVEDPQAGLHAVAYSNGAKTMIAFRGTTSETDKCADKILWEPDTQLPANCEKFNSSDLDYITQAKRFILTAVKSKHAGRDVLLTGHSLGCSLSQLMYLEWKQGKWNDDVDPDVQFSSLCFAPAGIRQIALRRNLTLPDQHEERMLFFANPFDPIVQLSETEQLGTKCTFKQVQEPLWCKLCLKRQKKKTMDSMACKLCFTKAHLFKNYLNIISDMTERPSCSKVNAVE